MGAKSRAIYQATKKALAKALEDKVKDLADNATELAVSMLMEVINQAIETYYATYGTIEPLLSLSGVKIELVPITEGGGSNPSIGGNEIDARKVKITWENPKDVWKNIGNQAIKTILGDTFGDILNQLTAIYDTSIQVYNQAMDVYNSSLEEAQDIRSQNSSVEMTNVTPGANASTMTMVTENGSSLTVVNLFAGTGSFTTTVVKV